MAWKGVITDAGAELITRWAANATLKISHALAGTGTVDETTLVSQSALVQYVQNMSIVSGEAVEGGTRVKVQITAPEEEYVLNQIGLFATIEDSDPILLALYQNNNGILIPNKSDAEDFVFSFLATIAVGSSGNLQIIIDSAAVVSQSTLVEAVSAHDNDTKAHQDIRDEIRYNSYKIGDTLTSIRPINDDAWLLCNNIPISEELYPELFAYLGVSSDIFTKEWNSQTLENSGASPVHAADGYVYFIAAGATIAYRCKPDFTEHESYTLLKQGLKYHYYNGYWFAADSSGLYYSTDGFKTEINTNTSFTCNANQQITSISYGEGYWYIGRYFTSNISRYYGVTYRAATLSDTFEYFGATDMPTPPDFDVDYHIRNIIYTNTAAVYAFMQKYVDTGSEKTHFHIIYYPNGLDGEYVRINSIYEEEYYEFVQHIPETDHIQYGKFVSIGSEVRNLCVYPKTFKYFKGCYYWLDYKGNIYRVNAYDISDDSTEVSTFYTGNLSVLSLGASDTYLYLIKDTNTILYLNKFEERVLPPLLQDSSYKTYIKCK